MGSSRGKLISRGKAVSLGADIYELPNDDSQPFAPYWDRKTGKIHPRLPADPWSIGHYNAKGLTLGNPPNIGGAEQVDQPLSSSDFEHKDSSVMELLKSMQEEIRDLKNKLAAQNGEAPPEGPVQLKLLD